jgi:precorrin-6Y C5,15-methyltransferase (decarboxylating)
MVLQWALGGVVERAGFGASLCHILEALGGERERIRSAPARDIAFNDVDAPVAMAIAFNGPAGLPRASGLADDLFAHDGQITKRPMRALALSALAPRAGDAVGSGRGLGLDQRGMVSDRRPGRGGGAQARPRRQHRQNAQSFGLGHRLTVIEHDHADLPDLPMPAAVFVGGGADEGLLTRLWAMLAPGVRLVMHAVTLETEACFSMPMPATAAIC